MAASTSPPCDDLLRQWAEQIRAAAARGQRLRIRGSGTKAFLADAPQSGTEILDTRAWRGIVNHEPTELVVTARAGTPLAELEAALAARGQCLPFEPPHFGPATVGGMVAAGLAGPARAAVGAVRDYVLGARLLNGRGEHLTFGGQVMKNVAGYDVSRALAGSAGALGVITEVSLKVLPRPFGEATLRLRLTQAAALQRLAQWRAQPLPINASLWADDGDAGALWLRLRGAAAAVAAASARLLAEVDGTPVPPEEAQALWQGVREQTLPFFTAPPSPQHDLWRLSVPATAPVLSEAAPTLVEWLGTLRWVWAPEQAAEALREQAARAGGHAWLWRAAPQRRTPLARTSALPAAMQALQQRVRLAFDPQRVFDATMWEV
ncbi:glycolate oxidase subunit GlcE [Tepidimonas charontis]|uniref:Putative FAD-linked oxidoreductase n=1 Tax=Tepidimonas charontis TaxID=2267262 RepID=A0A554X618_9BURK|nr:glycolate oxidase subunit GlcE [Tepidimonas charontis]TSE31247.1 putative FAD-linked oxidoreductase [Tepidimonas charontis]